MAATSGLMGVFGKSSDDPSIGESSNNKNVRMVVNILVAVVFVERVMPVEKLG